MPGCPEGRFTSRVDFEIRAPQIAANAVLRSGTRRRPDFLKGPTARAPLSLGRHKMTSFLTLLLLAAMLMTAGCSSPAASGSAYYVSPHGSDEAAGTTPTMPWRTLRRASQATLRPGSTRGGAAHHSHCHAHVCYVWRISPAPCSRHVVYGPVWRESLMIYTRGMKMTSPSPGLSQNTRY